MARATRNPVTDTVRNVSGSFKIGADEQKRHGRLRKLMAKQQFNRRLSDEAITAITWWAKQDSTPARKVTDTEIVEQAIAMYDAQRASGTTLDAVGPETSGGRGKATAEVLVQPLADSRPKNATCRHCGNRFAGPKFATICSECKSVGHTNDPRECPVCYERDGAA